MTRYNLPEARKLNYSDDLNDDNFVLLSFCQPFLV